MKTVVVALLDKVWPPEHSFIDGMLADEVAGLNKLKVRLCVSMSHRGATRARRYGKAACLPRLYPRRGLGRLLNLWVSYKIMAYQAAREKKRGRRVVLFVRNDPVCLLAASLLKRKVDRLVFQSTFPHEAYSGNIALRSLARVLYRLVRRSVNAVTGVSPAGVDRLKRFFPGAGVAGLIPLLSDLPFAPCDGAGISAPISTLPSFIYIGTHCKERELEVVLSAIVQAVSSGVSGVFRFVGISEDDEHRLTRVEGLKELMMNGVLVFEGPVSRSEIPAKLATADIGISLIPPKPMYYEASPTKLAEYMGAGLAVLASRGIPMQDQFVTESKGGVLVEWGVKEIAEGIMKISGDREKLSRMKSNSKTYAEKKLKYAFYLPQFLELIGEDRMHLSDSKQLS